MDLKTENRLLDLIEDDDSLISSNAKKELSEILYKENDTLEKAVNTMMNLAVGYVNQMSGYMGHEIYKREYAVAKNVIDQYVSLNKISLEQTYIQREIEKKNLRRKQYELLKLEFDQSS